MAASQMFSERPKGFLRLVALSMQEDKGPLARETNKVNSDISMTILVDNKAAHGLISEHGFSLWLRLGKRRILFDTGQGNALTTNARKLGLNLGETDTLVLSHGHYDHTGGISDVFRQSPQMDIYCHPGVVLPRYVIRNGDAHCIQMPRESILALNNIQESNLHWVSSTPVTFIAGTGITGAVPRLTDFEDVGGPFFLDAEGTRTDQIEDDQALWINTAEGLIICLGCCHAGLINTLDYICQITASSKVRAIIGGLHLLSADERRLERTIDSLKSFSPGLIVPCHCTGERATQLLGEVFGSRMLQGYSGMNINF
ncbi:MAG: MBL fold metallo-hydrolase [Pseudomonadota bacterium]